MELIFEHGDRSAPRGHALIYFRAMDDPDEVWATYLVVPPIAMDLAKYVPPMFASEVSLQMPTGTLAAYPLPPLPEKVEGHQWLSRLASARGDDVLDGGRINPSDLQRVMMSVSELSQAYASAYGAWLAREPQPEPELQGLDVDELLYSVMSESERISKIAKLAGSYRYAVEGGDARAASDAIAEMEKVGRHLDQKFRVDSLIRAARLPGAHGAKLIELYLERAYKIVNEDYAALGGLDQEIQKLEHGLDERAQ